MQIFIGVIIFSIAFTAWEYMLKEGIKDELEDERKEVNSYESWKYYEDVKAGKYP